MTAAALFRQDQYDNAPSRHCEDQRSNLLAYYKDTSSVDMTIALLRQALSVSRA